MKCKFCVIVLLIVFLFGTIKTQAETGIRFEVAPLHTEPEIIVIDSISSLVSSTVKIDPAFGDLQCLVDAQIYEGMLQVCNERSLRNTYPKVNNELMDYACSVINPCMAFATSKGEAGGQTSAKGVSMTTVLATNDRYYDESIDWVSVTSELSQIDEVWYLTHTDNNNQTNVQYKSCYMPKSYLQNGGSDGLGIGPYQITTSNWNDYTLEDRMSPTKGWLASMKKTGSTWLTSGVQPSSDLTVMALMAMSHQGGAIIDSECGRNIINNINDVSVQESIKRNAWKMYNDIKEKALSGILVNADDIRPNDYIKNVYEETGVNFSQWSYANFKTNTGNYVVTHTLQYMFYKYYFGLEVYE